MPACVYVCVLSSSTPLNPKNLNQKPETYMHLTNAGAEL
jgi:hypothetical protein